MGSNRARLPLEPASTASEKPSGLASKEPRSSDSHRRRSMPARRGSDPAQRRIPPHLEADVSPSDRDALAGLPFS